MSCMLFPSLHVSMFSNTVCVIVCSRCLSWCCKWWPKLSHVGVRKGLWSSREAIVSSQRKDNCDSDEHDGLGALLLRHGKSNINERAPRSPSWSATSGSGQSTMGQVDLWASSCRSDACEYSDRKKKVEEPKNREYMRWQTTRHACELVYKAKHLSRQRLDNRACNRTFTCVTQPRRANYCAIGAFWISFMSSRNGTWCSLTMEYVAGAVIAVFAGLLVVVVCCCGGSTFDW